MAGAGASLRGLFSDRCNTGLAKNTPESDWRAHAERHVELIVAYGNSPCLEPGGGVRIVVDICVQVGSGAGLPLAA